MTAVRASEAITVRVGPLVNIPELLAELGCEPAPVLRSAGLSVDELRDPDFQIPYPQAGRLLAACVSASRLEHFALLLGQKACPSHLGVVGFLMRCAPTVGQALMALEEYLDLHDRGGSCTLEVESDYCRLLFAVHQPGINAIAQAYDLSAVLMYQVMRTLLGADWVASEVLLVRKKPTNAAPYLNFFRTTVFFDSDACGIVFPAYLLERKALTADDLLFHHLEKEAKALHQLQPHEVVDVLPAMLQQGLFRNRFSAGDIASAFGVHERTLHRRLRTAGTSFRQELDRVRESLSLQLLEATTLPVCDIATSLGYADSSGFIRAFRRWKGVSPKAWRKRNWLH